MLDLAVAYNRYRFLGDEFLTWLWFLIETDQNTFRVIDPDCTALEIGNRIVLENRKNKSLERISIRGDDAGLEEGRLALKKGALLTELSLIFKTGEHQWQFSLKGESLNLSNFKTPGPPLPPSPEEMEIFLLDKTEQFNKITNFIELAFKAFIKIRVTSKWSAKVVPNIKKWIRSIDV
ncbi:MAG: hypothetical protein MUC57_02665 [Desulfobacterales bacterium]|jgi:hypothetical protein|nr:hypothetical protein [Desulfobacterales bacterium]